MQIALNAPESYGGGELIYANAAGLHVPPRPIGSATIHGAGGLNIPTYCLLSQHSDWRWLNDPETKRSYWYPSVGIARETLDDGWLLALQTVSQWISKGCPMPDGPVHTQTQQLETEHALVEQLGVNG